MNFSQRCSRVRVGADLMTHTARARATRAVGGGLRAYITNVPPPIVAAGARER
jgi:hypothetical protein